MRNRRDQVSRGHLKCSWSTVLISTDSGLRVGLGQLNRDSRDIQLCASFPEPLRPYVDGADDEIGEEASIGHLQDGAVYGSPPGRDLDAVGRG